MFNKTKFLNIYLFLIGLTLLHFNVSAQSQLYKMEGKTYAYEKPGTFDFILNVPKTFVGVSGDMFNSDYTTSYILLGASTAFFIVYDQPIYDQVSKWGRKWGLENGDNLTTYLSIADYPFFMGPSDIGSAMYFLGDGWTHLGICASFLTAGLINNDNRALQTASQIALGMLSVGSTIQVLKHITGRETPNRATREAGIWRFFPNQTDYHNQVPKYDAFPSGHLATAMMTVTIISNNYEDYPWIRPIGYGLMTLLSFQMINNGVHWISDYPLALGIGYLFGKIIVENGRKLLDDNYQSKSLKISLFPKFNFAGEIGLTCSVKF